MAIVDDKLFFTDDESCIEASSLWGRGNIFVGSIDCVGSFTFKDVDLSHRPGTHAEFKLPVNNNYLVNGVAHNLVNIRSTELFDIIAMFSKDNGVDICAFLKSMSSLPDQLELFYQDEHMKSGAGILVAMQFIEAVIRTSRKENNFSLTFLNEQFYDFKGTDSYPFKGMYGHDIRNSVIDQLAEQLYDDLQVDMATCPYSIDTLPVNGLTHWRVLIVKCGEKQISIYPNGGFINEWAYDKRTPAKAFDKNEDLKIDDQLPLFRRKEIKYEVIIDNE